MYTQDLTATVRKLGDSTCVIDLVGEITGFSEQRLMEAYARAEENSLQNLVLNFTDMSYMNSSGIGLLITLLIRAKRQGQKLVAYGLKDHFRKVFELTRLQESIPIYNSEIEALDGIGADIHTPTKAGD